MAFVFTHLFMSSSSLYEHHKVPFGNYSQATRVKRTYLAFILVKCCLINAMYLLLLQTHNLLC